MSNKKYWLMKSEPEAYSIDDLQRDGVEPWNGIRNYEARNFMRDHMSIGDEAFFYHSNVKPPCIVGIMTINSLPYPDPSQFDPASKYYDEKSSELNPTWMLVDVKFKQKFKKSISRDELKLEPELQNMVIFKKSRLSITPVTPDEWKRIIELSK